MGKVKTVAVAGLRGGRIAPLMDSVVKALTGKAVTVAAMAAKFDVPERDVRHAIDRARVKGWAIKRVAPNTFGLPAVKPKANKAAKPVAEITPA